MQEYKSPFKQHPGEWEYRGIKWTLADLEIHSTARDAASRDPWWQWQKSRELFATTGSKLYYDKMLSIVTADNPPDDTRRARLRRKQ